MFRHVYFFWHSGCSGTYIVCLCAHFGSEIFPHCERNVMALRSFGVGIFQHHGHSGRSQCHNIPIHGAVISMFPKHLSWKMPQCQVFMVLKQHLCQNFPLSMQPKAPQHQQLYVLDTQLNGWSSYLQVKSSFFTFVISRNFPIHTECSCCFTLHIFSQNLISDVYVIIQVKVNSLHLKNLVKRRQQFSHFSRPCIQTMRNNML